MSPRRPASMLLCLALLPVLSVAQRRYPNGTPIKKQKETVQKATTESTEPLELAEAPKEKRTEPAAQYLPSKASLVAAGDTVSESQVALKDKRATHDVLERSERSATIIREILDAKDHGLPQSVLDQAACVAVVPTLMKGGFGFGGQWGRGLVSCRQESKGWSTPAFFSVGGGSFGLQLGLEAVDLVMVISSRSGAAMMLRDKVSLGAGASATGFVLGRDVGVSTDPLLSARVFSYSRTRGLFAGLELKGAWINVDQKANEMIYGKEVHAHDIFDSATPLKFQGAERLYAFPRALSKASPSKVKYVKIKQVEKPPSPPAKAG